MRIHWLDHAKGLCIILVVMLYATESSGEPDSWLHAVETFAQPFRMPDFFLLSGLLLSRVIARDWRTYLDRKVVHFAYFYVLWLTILFAFQLPWMVEDDGWAAVRADYLHAFVRPYSMLWFIYLLPVFFVVTKLVHRAPAALVWMVAAALEVAQLEPGIKVLDKFASYYVYFYTGFVLAPRVCRLADAALTHRGKALLLLGAWAMANGWLASAGHAGAPLVSLVMALAGCAAVVSAAALAAPSRVFAPLAYCGRHSIVIYLAFYIPMSITQQLVDDAAVATAGGVIGALAMYWVVRGTRLRFLFERPRWISIDPKAGRSRYLERTASVSR